MFVSDFVSKYVQMLLVELELIRYRTVSFTLPICFFLSTDWQHKAATMWNFIFSEICPWGQLATISLIYLASQVLSVSLSLFSIPFFLPHTSTLTFTQIWVSCTFSFEPLLKSSGSFWPFPIRPFRELWRPSWGKGTGEGKVPPVGVPPMVEAGTWEQDMFCDWEHGEGLLLLLRPVPMPRPIMLLLKWWVL